MATLEERRTIVVVHCGDLRVGIPVDTVRKVVAAPVPSPLPEAPAIVAGLLNLHGTPLVVVDLARRGGGAREAITLASRIVVVETPSQSFGLLCEAVEGARAISDRDWLALDEIVPGTGYLAAGTAGEEELIVLRDPGTWLSASDVEDLKAAIDRHHFGLVS
ncbi:chemotaxis protein CheW [Xanthobacter pseudotagetidis]|uniref:chemotaxis protein CheW n=1 Tax=Xanthobacter pseudotagetidis TaxID=3119911 RepID=UPI003728B863